MIKLQTATKKKLIISAVCVALTAVFAFGTLYLINRRNDRIKSEERAKLIREYFDDKLTTYESENSENPVVDVVFLGDSLTDGCDLNKYYGEYTTFNRGIGGDTSYGLKDRLKVSVYDTEPKVVVLLIGGNDILGGKSLESVYANYRDIIEGIQENLPNAKIVWCSLTAMGNRWAEFNDEAIVCNQHIKLMANKYGCTFVDLFTPLCNVETGEIFSEYTAEGVHFTHEGYVVVSGEIKKALNELL